MIMAVWFKAIAGAVLVPAAQLVRTRSMNFGNLRALICLGIAGSIVGHSVLTVGLTTGPVAFATHVGTGILGLSIERVSALQLYVPATGPYRRATGKPMLTLAMEPGVGANIREAWCRKQVLGAFVCYLWTTFRMVTRT